MKVATYAMKGVDLYKKLYPDLKDEYIVAIDDRLEYGEYAQMAKDKRIRSITCLPCDDVVITTGYKKHKGRLATADKNGVFHVQLKNGSNIIVMRWITYVGGLRRYEAVKVGMDRDLLELERILSKAKKLRQKPPMGVHRCDNDRHGLVTYTKKKDKEYPDTAIIHPLLAELEHHIQHYFSNVARYMVNNRAGRKAVLLHGPQGTGKSSMSYRIARQYASEMSVAFVTNTYCLYNHVENCARYSVPTIVIFEDCEGDLTRNSGEVKNFLSGIDARQNKSGCYIIMTTNYPEKIEKTIIYRKGRIDKLFRIDKLAGEYLEQCIELYFSSIVAPDEMDGIKQCLSGKKLSGSEVEALVQECLTMAAKDGRTSVTAADVEDMYALMLEEMKGVEYSNADYEMDAGEAKDTFGFNL